MGSSPEVLLMEVDGVFHLLAKGRKKKTQTKPDLLHEELEKRMKGLLLHEREEDSFLLSFFSTFLMDLLLLDELIALLGKLLSKSLSKRSGGILLLPL
ncbi:MAG: hypothetical protein QXO75_11685 [Nitrososphaerota archaeon]